MDATRSRVLSSGSDIKALRERQAKLAADAKKRLIQQFEIDQLSFEDNATRLKALRLAKEKADKDGAD